MIRQLFSLVWGISLLGGVMVVAATGIGLVTRKWFPAKWNRTMLGAVLAFFLVPVGLLLAPLLRALPVPQRDAVLFPAQEIPLPLQMDAVPQAVEAAEVASNPLLAALGWLPLVWLGVCVLLLALRFWQMHLFRQNIVKTSLPVTDKPLLDLLEQARQTAGVTADVSLMVNGGIHTPMLAGLTRSRLILPDIQWGEQELQGVLSHELQHLKHRDLWIKWALLLLSAVHWFNPLIYLLKRQMNRWMELSCDQAVVEHMSAEQRLEYGRTVLSVLQLGEERPHEVCAAFCESKRGMKERLQAVIVMKKFSKLNKGLSALLLALIVGAGLLMGAASAPSDPVDASVASVTEESAKPSANAEDTVILIEEPEQMVQSAPEQFLWPVKGTIPVTTYPEHTGNGVDFAYGGSGGDIYASAEGFVTVREEAYTGFGHYLVIDHGGGYQTLYAHCESLLVEEGEWVEAGQLIATVGRTGWATGNHLHFEIRKDGEYMHPADYINPNNTPVEFPK